MPSDLYNAFNEFVETGELPYIFRDSLRNAFMNLGAVEEINENTVRSLHKYTNLGKSDGMRAVWGKNFDAYKKWAKEFVLTYEVTIGKALPALKPSGIKTSGMIAFFGELTAYAYGAMDWETLKKYSEARWHNGRMWEEDRKDERIKVEVPTSDKPILLSSYPPEFPVFAWVFISDGFTNRV